MIIYHFESYHLSHISIHFNRVGQLIWKYFYIINIQNNNINLFNELILNYIQYNFFWYHIWSF